MAKIIGIDLGHCETAAVTMIETVESGGSSEWRPSQLHLQKKAQVIHTQITLTARQMEVISRDGSLPSYDTLKKLGKFQYGEEMPAEIDDGEKFAYFKVAPKYFGRLCGKSEYAKKYKITHGQVMACFAYALLDGIFEYDVDGVFQGVDHSEIILRVGCPSTGDWLREDTRESYAALIRHATNINNVEIIPESRAAIFSSVSNGKSDISTENGAVVFDFGSSTADCTYMLLGRKMLEFSWTLGAFLIELNMTRDALTEAIAEIRESTPDFRIKETSILETANILRLYKEKFYTKGAMRARGERVLLEFQSTDGELVDGDIRVNEASMIRATEEIEVEIICDSTAQKKGSWRGLLREFLLEGKRAIEGSQYHFTDEDGKKGTRNCEIDSIVLTGGASNMGFIEEECAKIFPGKRIFKEANTSFSVSNGIGWVSVSDYNLPECIDGAKREIGNNDSCSVQKLKSDVSNALFNEICGIVEAKAKEWAALNGESSARVLKKSIDDYTSSKEGRERLTGVCEKAIASWKEYLSDAIYQAIEHQTVRLYSESAAKKIMIPHDVWKTIQSERVDFDLIELSDVMGSLDLGGFINKTINYSLSTVIWLTGLSWAWATFGLSLLASLIAKAVLDEMLKDSDLDKPRDKKVRGKVAENIRASLKEKKSEIMKDFENNFSSQVSGIDSVIDNVLRKAFEIITLKRFDM